jgi:hypothetical protein
LTALALLTFLVCIPAAVVTARAPAGWQHASASSTGTGLLRITGNRVDQLFPGVQRKLILTLKNNSKQAVHVRALRVRGLGTTKRGCAATRRNLRISRRTSQAFHLPPGAARTVAFTLTMPNTVADACQDAVFDLRYEALRAKTAR